MLPATLIHIRHGETDWNLAGRLQGSRDIPLNERGRGQAARNGARLKDWLRETGRDPGEFLWLASPMQRARTTMDIIRASLGLGSDGYTVDRRLAELSYGTLEGSTYDEVAARTPDVYARLRADKWHFLPPGGESYVMLQSRVAEVVAGIDRDTVIVSHGGVFRALLGLVRGVKDPSLAEMLVPQDQIFLARDGGEEWL